MSPPAPETFTRRTESGLHCCKCGATPPTLLYESSLKYIVCQKCNKKKCQHHKHKCVCGGFKDPASEMCIDCAIKKVKRKARGPDHAPTKRDVENEHRSQKQERRKFRFV